MKKTFFFLMVLLISKNLFSQFPNGYSRLNFECGGYCTEIIPTSDPNILYARTDVGGIYKSIDNSNNWNFISNDVFTTPASLMVQGLAVQPENPNLVLAGCGSSQYPNDTGIGLYLTTNGGNSWTHLGVSINFSGNGTDDFYKKIGGECIVFDPNNTNYVYFGGRKSGVLKLDLTTNTFSVLGTPNDLLGNISCIAINSSFPDEIWVGSDYGIWKGSLSTQSWIQCRTQIQVGRAVYHIILKPISNSASYRNHVYVSYYNTGSNNVGLMRSIDGGITWDESLTNNLYIDPLTSDNIVVGLSLLVDNSGGYNTLFASRMANPTKMATIDNFGNLTWGSALTMPINPLSSRPQFFLFNDYDQVVFYDKNNITQNLSNFNTLYCSGGSAPLKSNDGGNSWAYSYWGMSMPVVYKVFFDPYVQPGGDYIVYIPISDWTMAQTTYNNCQGFNVLTYARNKTIPAFDQDTYISNVTRALISGNTATVYLIGGSVYSPNNGAMCYTVNSGSTFTRLHSDPSDPFNQPNTALLDGSISTDYSPARDRMCVLLGASGGKVPVASPYGMYYSLDNGVTFNYSSFAGNDGHDKASLLQYNNSYIGTNFSSINGELPSLFSSEFNLASGPNNGITNDIKYLYLEGGYGGGGYFKSINGGQSWSFKSAVVKDPANQYKNEGCLCYANYNKLFLAMKNLGNMDLSTGGLFYTTYDETQQYWNFDNTWYSAEQVDATQDGASNRIVVAFGKRIVNGVYDRWNKIYKSLDDGTTWTEITNSSYRIPSVRSLTINLHNTNELWIATGGQGVFVYSGLTADNTNKLAKNKSPEPLSQNYPNPFNPSTNISFRISKDSYVKITVYDVLGREVRSLVNEFKKAGDYTVKFDGTNLASGIYFYRFENLGTIKVNKMILLK